jgi:Tweety.
MAHEADQVSTCINILVLMLLQSLLYGLLPYRQILWNGSCLLSEGWFVWIITACFRTYFVDCLQSLGILGSLPAAWLILTLLVLLIYLLTRCCDRKPRPKHSIVLLKWTLAIFTLLCWWVYKDTWVVKDIMDLETWSFTISRCEIIHIFSNSDGW